MPVLLLTEPPLMVGSLFVLPTPMALPALPPLLRLPRLTAPPLAPELAAPPLPAEAVNCPNPSSFTSSTLLVVSSLQRARQPAAQSPSDALAMPDRAAERL